MSNVPAGAGTASQIDQRLAQRLVGGVLPAVLGQEFAETLAPAHAVGAAFLAVAVADDDRDVHAHQRTDVAHDLPVGAHDLDMLPGRRERGRHLPHARVGWRADSASISCSSFALSSKEGEPIGFSSP